MSEVAPLETLYEVDGGNGLPLPPELASLYGRLSFPSHSTRPHVVGNFVASIDGVVSLNEPGQAGGGEISGFDPHDRMLMGLLRAVSDAVVVGAGTLRAVPDHLWTPEFAFPPLAGVYQQLRGALGKPEPPRTVIVTARGEVDLGLRVFRSGEAPVLVVTTTEGEQRIRSEGSVPPSVQIDPVGSAAPIRARSVLDAVCAVSHCDLILLEGGPHLMGDFLAEGGLDELFLTLAPQVAGRSDFDARPGLVAGRVFAPQHPLWGTLVGLKRGGSHLFLRYSFGAR